MFSIPYSPVLCVCVCVCAVSYTHLDVYKRQTVTSPSAKCWWLFNSNKLLAVKCKKAENRQERYTVKTEKVMCLFREVEEKKKNTFNYNVHNSATRKISLLIYMFSLTQVFSIIMVHDGSGPTCVSL